MGYIPVEVKLEEPGGSDCSDISQKTHTKRRKHRIYAVRCTIQRKTMLKEKIIRLPTFPI